MWVVLVLREDYVAALDPFATLMRDKLRARFYMERMDVEGALAAVRRPAALGGHPFADGVAEQLVDDLRRIQVAGQEATPLGQYVEPVQLQVVCYQLWENLFGGAGKRRLKSATQEISATDLERAGDVDTALADFYEDAIQAALRADGVELSERELRVWFEEELITEAGTRGTVYRGDDTTAGIDNRIVDVLQRRFLLRTELRAGGAWVELVHDRFVEPIRQANAAWLEQQSPLLRAAQAWDDAGRPPSLLLSQRQLATFGSTRTPEGIEPLVADYVDASQREAMAAAVREAEAERARELVHAQALAREANARHKAEAQRARLFKGLIVLAVIMTLGALLVGWRAVVDSRALAQALAEAERASEAADAARFVAQAKAEESARARAAAEEERNSALQLAQSVQALLGSTPLSPAASTEMSTLMELDLTTPQSITAALMLTDVLTSESISEGDDEPLETDSLATLPLPTAASYQPATTTVQAIVAEIDQVYARATQAAEPTPRPEPAEAALFAIAPDIDASLFADADLNADVLAQVRFPTRLRVEELSPEWAKVETADNITGWIRARFFTYEGPREALPLELRYRLVSGRDDLPFIYGRVTSFGGAEGDYLLRSPDDEQSGFRWIPVGTEVTVLQSSEGSPSYGSSIWLLVSLVDPDDAGRLLQGWLPQEVIREHESARPTATPLSTPTLTSATQTARTIRATQAAIAATPELTATPQ